MKNKYMHIITVCAVLCMAACSVAEQSGQSYSLANLLVNHLSPEAQQLLAQNGFVITPAQADDIDELYRSIEKNKEHVFVTTDALLHTGHIFFDYLLRIIEIEKLDPALRELTEIMLNASIQHYQQATNPAVKEAARLNIGFFAVPKTLYASEYKVGYDLQETVNAEIENISTAQGLKPRPLLIFVENPSLQTTPYAFEDYSQYRPRGHYTRNKTFETYFRVMMFYGRMNFNLRPAEKKPALTHGVKMTLQALLITDALMHNPRAETLWNNIYDVTTFFVGKADDLSASEYQKVICQVFPEKGAIDMYGDEDKLRRFIDTALKLEPPQIISAPVIQDQGDTQTATKGFRFMGQRFIPDSYIFQQLVFGARGGKLLFRYTGSRDPFTKEVVPGVGAVRAFPRGLDIFSVLGFTRAHEILIAEGDTDYSDYNEQMRVLRDEFSSITEEQWRQSLYWRWLAALIPLKKSWESESGCVPSFMKTAAWLDKALHTALGSWTELRHDTILYAKQSYGMVGTAFEPPKPTFGYVEPYSNVYSSMKEMMTTMREYLVNKDLAPDGVSPKIKEFEDLLSKLIDISNTERAGKPLADSEYEFIRFIGGHLSNVKDFPGDVMAKIISGTDEKMSIIADVHTEPNTSQVLEEAVGYPYNIYVILEDEKGRRLAHGAVFSYFEFKQPIDNRLTDEQWQEMLQTGKQPPHPDWVKSFIAIK